MKKFILTTFLSLLIAFSCIMRVDETGTRNNPFDAGGENWTINSPPLLRASVGNLWVDFNHTDSTGSYQLILAIDDNNFPFDTVTGNVRAGPNSIPLRLSATYSDTLLLTGIKPATMLHCSTSIVDKKFSKVLAVCSLTTPDIEPPLPPDPTFSQGSGGITIGWPAVAGATGYLVLIAADPDGPYTTIRSVPQAAAGSGTISFTDTLSNNAQHYYRFASYNASGTAYRRDTLSGRIYTSEVATPDRPSASQGTYTDAIQITCQAYYYSSISIEVQRSIGDTLFFRTVGVAGNNRSSGSSYFTYMDTVQTAQTCYYRICAIDAQGRCSYPSAIASGYTRRLDDVIINLKTADADCIRLAWYTVTSARYYRIYRSTVSCSAGMVLLDSTYGINYDDSVSDGGYYHYLVKAVDSRNNESGSLCASVRLTPISAPSGLSASRDAYLNLVILSWNPVPGALGYVIKRGLTPDSSKSSEIATAAQNVLTYCDSVPTVSLYYYQIATVGRNGRGDLCPAVSGYTMRPPSLRITQDSRTLVLSWNRHNFAQRYVVNRSRNDTLSFVPFASTTDTICTDTVKDFATYYYRMYMETSGGNSFVGTTVSAARILGPPDGFTAIDRETGVRLGWRPVAGADRYIIYRSTLAINLTEYREVQDTLFFDTIAGSDRYYYMVAAASGQRVSKPTLTINAGRIGQVQMPISFTANGKPEGILLSWSMPAGGSNPEGIIIFRSSSGNGTFTPVDTATGTTYCDSVPEFKQYYYRIAAYNSRGTSAPTSTVTEIRIRPAAPANVKATLGTSVRGITVSWTAVPSIKKYGLYRSSSGFSDSLHELLANVEGLSYFDTNVVMNGTYSYMITSYLPDGSQTERSNRATGIILARPWFREYTVTTSAITLTWRRIYFAERYLIYRKNSTDDQFVKIDSVTDGTFTRFVDGYIQMIDSVEIASYIDRHPLTGVNYYKISSWNTEETPLSYNTVAASTSSPGTYPSPVYESFNPTGGSVLIAGEPRKTSDTVK